MRYIDDFFYLIEPSPNERFPLYKQSQTFSLSKRLEDPIWVYVDAITQLVQSIDNGE